MARISSRASRLESDVLVTAPFPLELRRIRPYTESVTGHDATTAGWVEPHTTWRKYSAPAIRDHGTLTDITADAGMLFDITRGSVRLLAVTASSPLIPGSQGGTSPGADSSTTLGTSQTGGGTTTVPDATAGNPSDGGVLRETASDGQGDPSATSPGGGGGGSSGGGGTGSGGGSGGGGGGGRLPFTGLAVMGTAAIGAAAAGAGAALRRMLRDRDA